MSTDWFVDGALNVQPLPHGYMIIPNIADPSGIPVETFAVVNSAAPAHALGDLLRRTAQKRKADYLYVGELNHRSFTRRRWFRRDQRIEQDYCYAAIGSV